MLITPRPAEHFIANERKAIEIFQPKFQTLIACTRSQPVPALCAVLCCSVLMFRLVTLRLFPCLLVYEITRRLFQRITVSKMSQTRRALLLFLVLFCFHVINKRVGWCSQLHNLRWRAGEINDLFPFVVCGLHLHQLKNLDWIIYGHLLHNFSQMYCRILNIYIFHYLSVDVWYNVSMIKSFSLLIN